MHFLGAYFKVVTSKMQINKKMFFLDFFLFFTNNTICLPPHTTKNSYFYLYTYIDIGVYYYHITIIIEIAKALGHCAVLFAFRKI